MNRKALELMLDDLELPATAYEKAVLRYEDLGEFLSLNSSIAQYEPKIFAQGSFRIGTAIKPLVPTDPYDLDLTCKLEKGLSVSSITQRDFKILVGRSIDEYVVKRNIKKEKIEKRRCWRIEYQDSINFHMDVVPSIPMEDTSFIMESLIKSNFSLSDAKEWSELAYNITDNKKSDYMIISNDWNISNPEGYAKWFEWRMKIGTGILLMEKAGYKKLKTFEHKSILQRCVQILKRHRDVMFKNESDIKPSSIIITTLAAQSYNGESSLEDAITNIVSKMGSLVRSSGVRIANPTRPEEDFTDRWRENPEKEKAFIRWYTQAKADFSYMTTNNDLYGIMSKANSSFAVTLNEKMFGNSFTDKNINIQPHRVEIDEIPPRPHMWR
jgi:hypothetical protein